ncbi:Ppx/GppA phosphatase family protein [Cohaesibacter celericrescens]|uniref:Ppx/GppA phosphatase family protein n=1 Tax=Cohaesibacter celericrescens TaxID=2067669 RepID=UPI003568DF98
MRQGHSDQDRSEKSKGQQPGRKKRRSRSRRKRADTPANVEANAGALPNAQENPNRKSVDDGKAGAIAVSISNMVSHADAAAPHSDGSSSVSNPDSNQEAVKHGSRRRSRSGRQNSHGERNRATNASQGNASREQADQGNADRQEPRTRNGQGKARQDNARSDTDVAKVQTQRPSAKPTQNRPSAQPNRNSGHAAAGQARDTYAALDLGTNNCRLLVAEPHGQSFRVVDAFSRIVRLGEGLSQSGRLSEEAQDRAISALKVCQSKLSYRSVKRFRLIATEACRRASNGAAFLNRVQRETGLKLEIVDRETEARLAVSGCASLVHPDADGVVLFDIGGGSSEIVWLDLDPLSDDGAPLPGEKRNRQTRRAMRHLSDRIRCWTSLQVGVVTLSEKHGGQIVTREHFEAMVTEVRDMLVCFEEREALTKAIQSKHIHMLGTSGTVTTLAGVHLGLERYDRRLVDGTWLTAHELRSMITRILEMDFDERMNNPCIGHDRADLVLAGCAILEAFHREWPCPQLRVADRGLREGILMEMMIDDGVWNPQGNKKPSTKKRRSRRRGGRGHRGGQGQKQAVGQPEKET